MNIALLSFRFVQAEICSNNERYVHDEDAITYTSSNPIRLYKLMKEMHRFAKEIYPDVLYEYLDSGVTQY